MVLAGYRKGFDIGFSSRLESMVRQRKGHRDSGRTCSDVHPGSLGDRVGAEREDRRESAWTGGMRNP
jgi:hypothetical protein